MSVISNEKVASGGGSKVQINNYFTIGSSTGPKMEAAGSKTDMKRKRIS